MSEHADLVMYTIYDHPKDYPQNFVVREWRITALGLYHTENRWLYESLEAARQPLENRGLVCVVRQEKDDPVIIETWM